MRVDRRKYSMVPRKQRHGAKKESKQEIEQNQSRIYVYINKIFNPQFQISKFT